MLFSHLFGDVVLDQAVEGHHTADFQQHRDGGRLLSAPAVTGAASARNSPRHGLVMAQVAASWTAALLLAADFHAIHHVVSQQLALLQRRQVADKGNRLQLTPPTSADPLICCLWRGRQEKNGGEINNDKNNNYSYSFEEKGGKPHLLLSYAFFPNCKKQPAFISLGVAKHIHTSSVEQRVHIWIYFTSCQGKEEKTTSNPLLSPLS